MADLPQQATPSKLTWGEWRAPQLDDTDWSHARIKVAVDDGAPHPGFEPSPRVRGLTVDQCRALLAYVRETARGLDEECLSCLDPDNRPTLRALVETRKLGLHRWSSWCPTPLGRAVVGERRRQDGPRQWARETAPTLTDAVHLALEHPEAYPCTEGHGVAQAMELLERKSLYPESRDSFALTARGNAVRAYVREVAERLEDAPRRLLAKAAHETGAACFSWTSGISVLCAWRFAVRGTGDESRLFATDLGKAVARYLERQLREVEV